MVVRYIKVTFVTIFVLVIGLISTVNIKGANGVDDLDLEWYSGSDTFGNYTASIIDTTLTEWDTFFYGSIINNDAPMKINIEYSNLGDIESIVLEPNIYIIYHEPLNENERLVSITVGGSLPEYEVFRKVFDTEIEGYIIFEFYYYTSGILKDYYDVGYDVGNQQPSNVGVQLPNGVSDTIEFRNGQAYYVQRVKKYTLQASDISFLTSTINLSVYVTSIDLDNYIGGILGLSQNYYITYWPEQSVQDVALMTTDNIGNSYNSSGSNNKRIRFVFPVETTLAEAQADLVGTEIYYQLAEPIETLIILGGELQDYYNYGYDDGYDDGIFIVYENGFNGIINPNNNEFYKNKDSYPYGIGYNDGLLNSEGFTFTGLLTQIFVGIGSILGIELLPNITIGAIVAVPIVFGIIYFILGKRSKD